MEGEGYLLDDDGYNVLHRQLIAVANGYTYIFEVKSVFQSYTPSL